MCPDATPPSADRIPPRAADAVGRRALDDAARAVARARQLEERVQRLGESMRTTEEIAIDVVETALDALGASVGVAMRRTSRGDALELTGAVHVPSDVCERFQTIAIDAPMPAAEVIRTGEPCYCETREQLVTHFPAMREFVEQFNLHALAAVPVRHLGALQGAVVFGFPAPHRFVAAERATLRAQAARYARALREGRRYFAEHDARAAEEAARRAAEEARTVAEAAARAHGDYVAVVSHELRTPLQAIIGYAQILADEVAGELAPQQQEFARRIAMGSLSLLQIVENLLGFSAAQIGRQHVEIAPFDLGRIVDEVIALAEPLAARKGLALRAEVPTLPMWSDALKVRQILTNLIGNAIKFTDRGEIVVSAVRMELPSHAGASGAREQVSLTVRDTGSGIPSADLPRLFEPFWHGAHVGTAGGTGLGLSIVRQLARLLGGDVRVESTPGEGSSFIVTLPLDEEPAPAAV